MLGKPKQYLAAAAVICRMQQRWLAAKAPNRAAVHGLKLPAPDVIPMEKLEREEMKRAIEEKERRRMEIEESVDSQLNKWQQRLLYVSKMV